MSHSGRTYIPTLIYLLRRICKYIVKYGPVLNAHLTETQRGYLDEIMAACTALTDDLGELPVNP